MSLDSSGCLLHTTLRLTWLPFHQFQEALIQSGYAGGQRAAQTLLSALPNLAASSSFNDDSNGIEVTVDANGSVTSSSPTDGERNTAAQAKELGSVIVQVFLNKSGLGTALKQVSTNPKTTSGTGCLDLTKWPPVDRLGT